MYNKMHMIIQKKGGGKWYLKDLNIYDIIEGRK